MVAMYNPQDALYRDERSVRLEVSRVFDVCYACRKCFDLCAVFPNLVDTVAATGRSDGALLTPVQQDEVLAPCTMCMQCVAQCPEPVHFPALVLRQRAMLWVSQYVSVRQKVMALCTGRSASWLRRWPFLRPLLWGVTAKFEWLPELSSSPGAPGVTRVKRQRVSHLGNQSHAVLFSTCPVDVREPHIISDFVAMCAERDIACAVSKEFICCGAPDLYAGNVGRFRTVARKNRAVLDAYKKNGHHVIVGNSACRATMVQMYPLYVPSGSQDHDGHVGRGDDVVDLARFFTP